MVYIETRDVPSLRLRNAARYRLTKRLGLVSLARLIGHRAWLPEGLRGRIARLTCTADYFPSQLFEVDFFGLKYPGDLSNFLDWHVYFFGAYEMDILLLLRSLIRQRSGGVFVDVGANVGQHALFMSKYASHIHAFEPWSKVRQAIDEKITRNRLTNVTVHPVALGVEHQFVPFYAPQGGNWGTGSFDEKHATDRNRLWGNLEIVRGDQYFEAHGISAVSLIKIDVEGWEKNVLLGLRHTLERFRPVIVMEVSRDTLRSLSGLEGFRRCIPEFYEALYVHSTRTGATRMVPFDARRPGDVLLRPAS